MRARDQDRRQVYHNTAANEVDEMAAVLAVAHMEQGGRD